MIKKIKWHNHAILGNLELDFTKPDGTIYDTIVLAGENGTGKTTVLDEQTKMPHQNQVRHREKYPCNRTFMCILSVA